MRFLFEAFLFYLLYVYLIQPFIRGIMGLNDRRDYIRYDRPTPRPRNPPPSEEYTEYEEVTGK